LQIRVLTFSFHHLLKSVFKRFAVTVNAERLFVLICHVTHQYGG